MSFFSFGVLTNKMIKQEVSVINYCKHVHQSLISSELPPGSVMGNKMEKQSKFLNSFGEQWPNRLLEMPPANKTPAGPGLPHFSAVLRQYGQRAAELHPPLLGSILKSLQCLFPPLFIPAQLDPLTFTFAVAMTK